MRRLALAATVVGALGAAPAEFAKAPTLTPQPQWPGPVSTVASTRSGTKVVILEQHSLPLVHLTAVVKAGSALDPTDRPGLASAVTMMLAEGGAGSRNALELAQSLDDLGGELHSSVDEDATRLFMTVPSRNLERALALFGDLLVRPRFDPREWTRARGRLLAEIQRKRDEPQQLADDLFKEVLFGEHPYGHPVIGTQAAVEKLTIEELRDFHQKHYGPKSLSLLLVGDATLGKALPLVERAFAGSTSTVASSPSVPAIDPANRGRTGQPDQVRIVLVDRPGAPQSEVRVGHLGISWQTPDLAASSLLEMVLGGSFTSRLMQNLREKHGYTYGAHATFHVWHDPGPFEIAAAIRTDVTGMALKEIFDELKGMNAPLSNEEVKKGRSLVAAMIVERFTDGMNASSQLGDLLVHDISLDFWGRLPIALQALDASMLTTAAARLFHPELLTVVIVGDRKKVEPQLKHLSFPHQIEIRSAD